VASEEAPESIIVPQTRSGSNRCGSLSGSYTDTGKNLSGDHEYAMPCLAAMHFILRNMSFRKYWFLAICLIALLSVPVVSRAQATLDREALLSDVETLSSDRFEGRATGTPGGISARDFVRDRFAQTGLDSLLVQPFSFVDRRGTSLRGYNVIGYLYGNDNPDSYIVVSAHFDHLGVRNGEIYNGADDNASGVGALIAIASYFHKHRPQNSIIFAAFDAEEHGLRGAKAFMARPPVDPKQINMNVNLDMVSRSQNKELFAAGTAHFPALKPILNNVGRRSIIRLRFGHDTPDLGSDDWTRQSDQGPFFNAGIPFIYFGVEDHPDYHRPTDDFERIMPDFYVAAVETIINAVVAFDVNLDVLHRSVTTESN